MNIAFLNGRGYFFNRIMTDFNKAFAMKIISLILVITFTVTSSGYGMDFAHKSSQANLRTPLLLNKNIDGEGGNRWSSAAGKLWREKGKIPAISIAISLQGFLRGAQESLYALYKRPSMVFLLLAVIFPFLMKYEIASAPSFKQGEGITNPPAVRMSWIWQGTKTGKVDEKDDSEKDLSGRIQTILSLVKYDDARALEGEVWRLINDSWLEKELKQIIVTAKEKKDAAALQLLLDNLSVFGNRVGEDIFQEIRLANETGNRQPEKSDVSSSKTKAINIRDVRRVMAFWENLHSGKTLPGNLYEEVENLSYDSEHYLLKELLSAISNASPTARETMKGVSGNIIPVFYKGFKERYENARPMPGYINREGRWKLREERLGVLSDYVRDNASVVEFNKEKGYFGIAVEENVMESLHKIIFVMTHKVYGTLYPCLNGSFDQPAGWNQGVQNVRIELNAYRTSIKILNELIETYTDTLEWARQNRPELKDPLTSFLAELKLALEYEAKSLTDREAFLTLYSKNYAYEAESLIKDAWIMVSLGELIKRDGDNIGEVSGLEYEMALKQLTLPTFDPNVYFKFFLENLRFEKTSMTKDRTKNLRSSLWGHTNVIVVENVKEIPEIIGFEPDNTNDAGIMNIQEDMNEAPRRNIGIRPEVRENLGRFMAVYLHKHIGIGYAINQEFEHDIGSIEGRIEIERIAYVNSMQVLNDLAEEYTRALEWYEENGIEGLQEHQMYGIRSWRMEEISGGLEADELFQALKDFVTQLTFGLEYQRQKFEDWKERVKNRSSMNIDAESSYDVNATAGYSSLIRVENESVMNVILPDMNGFLAANTGI